MFEQKITVYYILLGLGETITTVAEGMHFERVTYGEYKEASKALEIFETKHSQGRRNISL